jgi:hypothetical protein
MGTDRKDRPRYAGGYGAAGRIAAVNAAAVHLGWSPRQRARELVRLYRRDKARPAPVSRPRAARAIRPRSRSVRTSPRAANAPPSEEGDEPPGDDAPLSVERPRRRSDLLPARHYVVRAIERLAVAA